MNVFDDGPGQRESVVGGGAAADFIKHDQAARGGGVQDHSGFGHFDHEGGTAARQVIGGADSGENPIDDGKQRGFGGNEGTHLRQDRKQRGLAEIRGFAAHVGSCDDGDEFGFGVEIEIVGDEALGVFRGQFFDDGMASGNHPHFAGGVGKRGRT